MSFKHKKKFGQNFLTNQSEVLKKIMEVSGVEESDVVLEIGPGEGALTELLLETSSKVIVAISEVKTCPLTTPSESIPKSIKACSKLGSGIAVV